MKKFKLIFLAILLFPNAVFAERIVTLAYIENGLSELKNNEKQVALQLLSNELIQGSSFQMQIKPMVALFQNYLHQLNNK